MDKETFKKILSCKALQGKTVADIIMMPRFRDNLAAYWEAQKADREAIKRSYLAMKKVASEKGHQLSKKDYEKIVKSRTKYKLPAHCIDDLMALSVDDMAIEYAKVVTRQSNRVAAEREYIEQLGRQAYNITIAQIAVEEFPELKPVLFPKPKNVN